MPLRLRKNKPWSDADSARLRALVASGASAFRGSAAFDRPISVIREKARQLGTPFPTIKDTRRKFSDDPSSFWRQY
jgi:hypothetical protein